jgi:large exoprotein involved in heme utilization and adhesion
LGVDGPANLFFLNPNGLIFGPNARLDVRGSFIGSTASGLQFGTQGDFNTTTPQPPSPLLTVKPSALLFTQMQAGGIVNRARSTDRTGLTVPTGSSLLLIGGNILSDDGQLTVSGGRIELGGLAAPGTVALTNNDDRWQVSFPTGVQRSDITLSNEGLIANTGGLDDIAITGRTITVANTPLLPVVLKGTGISGQRAGDLILNATGTVSFDYSNTQNNGLGNAIVEETGRLSITAENISLKRTSLGSVAGSSNRGTSLNASGTITLDGSFIEAGRNPQAGETSGNIDITARNLTLTNGSSISISGITTTNDVGKISLQVLDTLSLFGKSSITTSDNASGGVLDRRSGDIEIQAGALFLNGQDNLISTFSNSSRPGNVQIQADTITVNGGDIRSTSTGVADGGSIDIQTRVLSVMTGGSVATSSRGAGNSGNLSIGASEAIEVKGNSPEPIQLGDGSSAFVSSRLSASSLGTGNAGTLTLNTGRLSVLDSAAITSGSSVSGRAGDVTINATGLVEVAGSNDRIRSSITATSQGTGDAGNIFIRANRLSLRDGGNVVTFTAKENAIDARVVVSKPDETNRIAANAFTGRGGNISISTQALLGIRPSDVPIDGQSTITASSQVGVQGQVTVNQPEVQPTQGAIELPTGLIDASDQIAQVCPHGLAEQGRFVISGRGSLPESPINPLSGIGLSSPLAEIEGQTHFTSATSTNPDRRSTSSKRSTSIASPEMIEAQGWTKTREGKVILLAGSRESGTSTQTRCPG